MSKYASITDITNSILRKEALDVVVDRFAFKSQYTVGNLFVNGLLFCDTMEDFDRGADQSMPFTKTGTNVGYWTKPDGSRIQKVYAQTAIPTGTYGAHLAWSSLGRRLPLLENVGGFTDILFHNGKTHRNSAGCVLVGRNTIVGALTNDRQAMLDVCQMFLCAEREDIDSSVTIKRRTR